MAAMDDVPREILQAAYVRSHVHLWKVPFHFALWVGSTFLLLAIQGT